MKRIYFVLILLFLLLGILVYIDIISINTGLLITRPLLLPVLIFHGFKDRTITGIGFISLVFISVLGSVFKILHLPLAGAMLALGLFSDLAFLIVMIVWFLKKRNIHLLLSGLLASAFFLSVIFFNILSVYIAGVGTLYFLILLVTHNFKSNEIVEDLVSLQVLLWCIVILGTSFHG